MPEIERGGRAFDPKQLLPGDRSRAIIFGGALQPEQNGGGRFDVIAHQQGALVPDLPRDHGAAEEEGGCRIRCNRELPDPRKDIGQVMPPGESIEPATRREIADRRFLLA